MTPNFNNNTQLAIQAALEAWKVIRPFFRSDFEVFQKVDGPATEADRLADQRITDFLQQHEDSTLTGYLTEEFEHGEERLTKERVWIIDPIDGTVDFMKGSEEFAIHIALAVRNESGRYDAVSSVVFNPVPGRLYLAEKDQGAWMLTFDSMGESGIPEAPTDWQRFVIETSKLQVSSQYQLAETVAVISRSNPTPRLQRAIETVPVKDYYRRGSMGVKTMEVASGRADLYLHTEIGVCREWDICAPHLILQESGGMLTDLNGKGPAYNQPGLQKFQGVIISNGVIHEELLKSLDTVEWPE